MQSKPTTEAAVLHEEEIKDASSPQPRVEAVVAGVGESSHHKSKAERWLVLKQDLLIMPLLSMGYFFGYLVWRLCKAIPLMKSSY